MTSRHRSDQSPLRGPMPQHANAACGLPTPEVPSRSLRRSADMTFMPSPFLALLSGTGKRVGSAPKANETVFGEGPDDIVCGVSKALAPAMSDGNQNPEGFRTEERSPPGRGALETV